jgi:hypothetical protein
MNVFNKWLLLVSGLVLIAYSVQLFQMSRAIDAWQVEVERLNAEVERLEIQTESDYYRGVMSACTGIGVRMEVPGSIVAQQCAAFVGSAYQADWFNELRIDSWTWPPKKE